MEGSRTERHDAEMLTRYAFADLDEDEKSAVERHVQTCVQCRDFLSFIQGFNAGLRQAKPREPLPGEPCPDPALLADLQEGNLDDETAQHVRVHMLFCNACTKDYEALRKSEPKSVGASLRIARGLVVALRVSGTGDWATVPLRTATRETKRLFIAPFHASERLTDPDTGAETTVTLAVKEDVRPARLSVDAHFMPVPEGWSLSLLDADRDELASFSIRMEDHSVRSELAYGFYALEILKGEFCVGRFSFTVEPFSLPEALTASLKYLRLRQYGRALAILEDGAERFPHSRELWELQCLARDLAAIDAEAFEDEQRGFGQVRRAEDFTEESRRFLEDVRRRWGTGIAYLFAAASFGEKSYPADFPARIQSDEVSLPVLLALDVLREHVGGGEANLARLLSPVAARLDGVSAEVKKLQESVDAVRSDVGKGVDEKFKEVSTLLHSIDNSMTAQRVSAGDYSAVFRDVLGEEGWTWLGAEVEKIFVSAEGLYWYLGSRPNVEGVDYSPALLQFCRGLELLLNMKLGPVCDHVQERVGADSDLRSLAGSKLPMINIELVFRRQPTLSLTQIANFLRVGRVVAAARPSSLREDVTKIVAGSGGLPETEFTIALEQVGMFFRNGKIHPRAGSPSLFTTSQEMDLLRKLMFGLDENHVDCARLLSRLQNAAWLSAADRQAAYLKLSRTWEKYPGLIQILWRTLGTPEVFA